MQIGDSHDGLGNNIILSDAMGVGGGELDIKARRESEENEYGLVTDSTWTGRKESR